MVCSAFWSQDEGVKYQQTLMEPQKFYYILSATCWAGIMQCHLAVSTGQQVKIVAAFRGMHVSPAKHSFGKCDVWQTDRQTDDGQSDPYVSLCFAGDTKIWSLEDCLHCIAEILLNGTLNHNKLDRGCPNGTNTPCGDNFSRHILDSWGVCMWSFIMIGVKRK